MADDDTTGRDGGPLPMRISDADRQRMIDVLQKHMGAGRLDIAEFERRVEHASGAIHDRDLDGLLDDLPPLGDEAATGGSRGGPAVGGGPRRRASRDRSGWWSPDAGGGGRPPWAWHGGIPAPVFVLGAVALVVLTHGWVLFPLLFLFLFASGRGRPCGPRRHHSHRGHQGHHGHRGHDRWATGRYDGDHGHGRWWGDDEADWDEPAPPRPTWPGRYDPDRDDRVV